MSASLSRREVVEREYATSERLEARRLDRTALLSGEEPWLVALAAIAEARPQRVLDAGCGTGDFAALIAAPTVACVDLSSAMVERARARGLDAREADIAALPFADGEFDVVTCNWVLYHLADVDGGLAEIARVIGPGGRFVGIYNHRDHLRELWDAVGARWVDTGFGCDDGLPALRRHFARVERRETRGEAVWETPGRLQAYLDAFLGLAGRLEAPAAPYPFRATRHNCVLVGEKP